LHAGCGPVEYVTVEYRLDAMLHHLAETKKPVVAVADGIVMGGGAGLFEGAGKRVATPNSVFAMPECRIAILPDAGAMGFLMRVGGCGGECLFGWIWMWVILCVVVPSTPHPHFPPTLPYRTTRRATPTLHHVVPQAPGHVPMYIALTGARLSGICMRATQLATHLVDSSQVPSLLQRLRGLEAVTAEAVEEAVAAHALPPTDEAQVRACVRAWSGRGMWVCGYTYMRFRPIEIEIEIGWLCVRVFLCLSLLSILPKIQIESRRGLIDEIFGKESVRAIYDALCARLEQQSPPDDSEGKKDSGDSSSDREWLATAKAALELECPASHVATFHAVRTAQRGRAQGTWGIDRGLALEFVGVGGLGIRADFVEGVQTAVGERKGERPQWSHESWEAAAADPAIQALLDKMDGAGSIWDHIGGR
jgi:enoyl-CoA hydratase/carnithine racemase